MKDFSPEMNHFDRQFKLKKNTKFLNHAATNPITKEASIIMRKIARQAMDPMDEHLVDWLGMIEQARRQTANLLKASADEIAFVQSTSAGLSLIANMIPFKNGDVILYDKDDFPSNRFIWDCMCYRNEISIQAVAFSYTTGEDLLETLSQYDISRVRVISLSAVSYYTGYRHNLKAIGKFCRENGIYLCVDAIQAVGALDIDLSDLCDISFLACGGQKWLHSPMGSGFIFIRKNLMEEVKMPMLGWTSVDKAGFFHAEHMKWLEGASRFEAGFPDVNVIAALGRNIELYNSFDIKNIEAEVKKRVNMIHKAAEGWPVKILNTDYQRNPSGIVSFELDSKALSEEIDNALEKRNIAVTRRNNYFRIAPHFHTREEHILETIDIFSKYLTKTRTSSKIEQVHETASLPKTKTAAVVGASGGLGEAVAEDLASRGYDLYLTARDEKALDDLALRLKKTYHIQVSKLKVNLSDQNEVDYLSKTLAGASLDFFAYTAAASSAIKVIEQSNLDEKQIFDVNYFTPVQLCKSIMPGMIKRNSGHLLFIVTAGARNSTPLFSTYAASKGALWSWAESLARELKGLSVTCTIGIPPHMSSATQQKLARNALRYNRIKNTEDMAYPSVVAKDLINASIEGQPVYASRITRIRHAFNALFPGYMQKMVTAKYEP
ncbi:MAG: aminotransferase class V-fold PLP-dependent enzyme [Clostridia bacterium]|nr:aminotransferase class V-fold PLP-dependent enzyme [Clostridia bacterium]